MLRTQGILYGYQERTGHISFYNAARYLFLMGMPLKGALRELAGRKE